jgi:hypothetical protein
VRFIEVAGLFKQYLCSCAFDEPSGRHVVKHVSLHAGFALRNCMTFVNIMECDVMV